MKKPGLSRLRKVCMEASRETGIPFFVQVDTAGVHKGTVRYTYCIFRGGKYPGPVTQNGNPAKVEAEFSVLMGRFREAMS